MPTRRRPCGGASHGSRRRAPDRRRRRVDRPGAVPSGRPRRNCGRVLPVIRALHAELDVVISVDTSRCGGHRGGGRRRASFINDVPRPARSDALAAAPRAAAECCVMHMQGEPGTMQNAPAYGDVVVEVAAWLAGSRAGVRAAGIASGAIAVDPVLDSARTPATTWLCSRRSRSSRASVPALLVGLSRKSWLATLTGRALEARLAAAWHWRPSQRAAERTSCAPTMSPRPWMRYGLVRRSGARLQEMHK